MNVFDTFQVRIAPEYDGVETLFAHPREDRLEFRQIRHCGARSIRLVADQYWLAEDIAYRHDRVLEVTFRLCERSAALAFDSVRIDLLAAESLESGHEVGSNAVRNVWKVATDTRVGIYGTSIAANGHARH